MSILKRLRWPPIRLVLPLSLLLVSGGIIGSFWWFETQREMSAIEDEAVAHQTEDMQRLVGYLQRDLESGNMQRLGEELSDYGAEPQMRFMLLSDPQGQVIAATRPEWVGRQLSGIGKIVSTRLQAGEQPVRLSADEMYVWSQFPVDFPTLRGKSSATGIGMLVAKYDLHSAKKAAGLRIERWVGMFALMVLGIAFLFWLIMRYAITERMNQLIAASNRASRGDFSVRAGLLGTDELAQIGSALDSMLEQLGRETSMLRQLSRAVENMNEGVLITDATGTIQYVNGAFTDITGYTADEAFGKNPRILKSGRHPQEFYQAFWGRIAQGKMWKGRMIDRRKDGSIYTAKVSVAPLLDGEGNITHFVSVQEDVTDQQKMEAQLLQAQKMESLGTLVGGIAHDFNNMLAGMVGNLYMARKRIKDMPDVTQKLERVEKLGFRAGDMIKQLLAFARKDMVEFRRIELGPFVKEACKLSRAVVPENIRFSTEVDSGPLSVECDATQVQQILMSLLNNARDALDGVEEPVISLTLHRYEPDPVFLVEHPEADASAYALLSVADNGCGIPEEAVEHIFEPFFTTKGVGQGSGLGLAMVFGAMQRHKGVIEVDSSPGHGSTFHLYFPLAEAQGGAIPEETDAWHGSGERLLVADDEPIVRETLCEMLRIDGYQVDMAHDGLEAVEQFTAKPEAYAAVLLDVVMPRMGGMEAAQRMREVRPDIPILFATGYDREHVLRGASDMRCVASLSKPLHSTTLRRALAELLGGEKEED